VTHLLCVGGLEALCCKGCSVVGLCGGGVVCERGLVLDGCLVRGGVLCGCGALRGCGCGHDRNFPEIFGERGKLF